MRAAILLLAFALRLYHLSTQSLWYDEAGSLHFATSGLPGLVADFNPPLYYATLGLWVRLAGESDFALRYLSLLFGVLAIPLVYVLGRRLANPTVGFLAALLAATSPFLVYYSQETRMYSLVGLLALLSACFALDLLAGKRRAALLYVASTVLAFYTHYFALLVLLVENLCAGLGWVGGNQRFHVFHLPSSIFHWLSAQLAIVALVSPWLVAQGSSLAGRRDFWRTSLGLGDMVVDLLRNFALGEAWQPHADWAPLFALLAALGVASALRPQARRASLVSLAALAIPLLIVYLAPRPVYTPRYLIVVAPAFYLLLALGVWGTGSWEAGKRGSEEARKPGRQEAGAPLSLFPTSSLPHFRPSSFGLPIAACALALLLAANLASLSTLYWDSRYYRDDYRGLVAALEPLMRPDDALVFVAGRMDYPFFHYARGRYRFVPVDWDRPFDETFRPPDLLALLRDESLSRLWLVRATLASDLIHDPQRVIPRLLAAGGAVPVAEKRVHRLDATLYEKANWQGVGEATPLEVDFAPPGGRREGWLRLAAYSLERGGLAPGGEIGVGLYWQALAGVPADYWASVQLADEGLTRALAQRDFRIGGIVPTSTWHSGLRQRDEIRLALPAALAPGRYRLIVAVYDPSTQSRLEATGPQSLPGDAASLATLELR